MEKITLRQATTDDLNEAMAILAQGREAQRKQGFRQWNDNYPPEELVMADILQGNAHILEADGKSAGYVALTSGDDEYERLAPVWLPGHRPYGVLHRMAIGDAFRGRGLANILLEKSEARLATTGAFSIRVDTGLQNLVMQHILTRRGYANLGAHTFAWGERLAFEKKL